MFGERNEVVRDEQFAYLIRLVPEAEDIVQDLKRKQRDRRTLDHAAFWLKFLEKYDRVTRQVRARLVEEGVSDLSRHERSIQAFFRMNVQDAVQCSFESGFFESVDGKFRHPAAGGMSRFVHRDVSDEELDDQHLDLISVPLRLRRAIER